jgi:flagellar FliJ protein
MFQFRLQRILDMRQQREQAVAGELAEARGSEERARLAAEALVKARNEGAESASRAQTLQLSAGQLQNLRYVVERMSDHVRVATEDAETARVNVDRCMVEFTTAFRNRKVLDRLRDRALTGWKADEVQADRRLMDEIALSRFSRRDPDPQEGPK